MQVVTLGALGSGNMSPLAEEAGAGSRMRNGGGSGHLGLGSTAHSAGPETLGYTNR